jgi:hypothetical protein
MADIHLRCSLDYFFPTQETWIVYDPQLRVVNPCRSTKCFRAGQRLELAMGCHRSDYDVREGEARKRVWVGQGASCRRGYHPEDPLSFQRPSRPGGARACLKVIGQNPRPDSNRFNTVPNLADALVLCSGSHDNLRLRPRSATHRPQSM